MWRERTFYLHSELKWLHYDIIFSWLVKKGIKITQVEESQVGKPRRTSKALLAARKRVQRGRERDVYNGRKEKTHSCQLNTLCAMFGHFFSRNVCINTWFRKPKQKAKRWLGPE